MQNQNCRDNIWNMSVLTFLETQPMKGYVFGVCKSNKPKIITNRILTVYGFIDKTFSFYEMFLLLLPSELKSEMLKKKFLKFRDDKISGEVKTHLEKFINKDGSIDLYGKHFYPANANYGELVELLSEIFLADQYCAREYLKDGDVVIDAGANIGSFSVFCSNLKRGVVVYAFEPVMGTFNTLKKNTQNYPNIHCIKSGLGSKIDCQKIYYSPDKSTGSSFNVGDRSNDESGDCLSEETGIDTIDNYIVNNSIQKVDFIKIDTEGFEAEILDGAKETIKRFKPVIAVSAYHKLDDKFTLPRFVKSINSSYKSKLLGSNSYEREEDLIFYMDR